MKREPLTEEMGLVEKHPNIALIIGCARSGTSILGELLAAHPAVTYIFEAPRIWERAGLGLNESHRLVATQATPEVKQSIELFSQEWYQQVHAGQPQEV